MKKIYLLLILLLLCTNKVYATLADPTSQTDCDTRIVNFDANGGTCTSTSIVPTFKTIQEYTRCSFTFPTCTREGYTFKGFAYKTATTTTSDACDAATTYTPAGNTYYVLTASTEYAACWEANESDNTSTETSSSGLKSLKIMANGQEVSLEGTNSCTTSESCAYSLPSGTTTFSISAEAEDASVTITLKSGDNVISDASNITYSPDNSGSMLITLNIGSTEKYINITRNSDESSDSTTEYDNTLSTLVVGGNQVDLSSCTQEVTNDWVCNISVDSSEGFKVTATLKDETNFNIDTDNTAICVNSSSGLTCNGVFMIKIVPKSGIDASGSTYTINVEQPTETSQEDSGESTTETYTNPSTGNTFIFAVLIILIGSLFTSIYIYKKNIAGYNN